jgi:hypothetical protein
MPLDKVQLKTKLLTQYSDQLDKMFESLDKPEGLHLTEIEDAALHVRQQVSQEITQSLSDHESQNRDVDVCCPNCKTRAHNKGQKSKWIKTRGGEIQVNRPYWYCLKCKTVFFPTG